MLKGMYFMGWQRDMWNYHPSLPMRNLHMVDDISDIHGNMLVWSCLGSGAIGLPYMDLEANGDTPPRMRLYGYMNDKEFCAECAKRGIKVFSVLWKGQLWEFGAEFNEDESKLLSLNILRGASDNHGYVGMSELSTNRYPKLFAPIEKFFPDGITNFKGEKVGDFMEEFKAVSLQGRNILSAWLMAPDHDHKCYSPCGNKDTYAQYLCRDVEMMIDAGAGGLHIDEYDTQKHVIQNAGCFCDECVHKFNIWLKEHNVPLPEDVTDLENFNYRQYLLNKGYTDENVLACALNTRWEIPLYKEYVDMQMDSIRALVETLSTHAKAYAKKTRGEDFPVTANLFQCYPQTWNVKKYLDILSGEKTDIRLRQDGWYKYAFGWLNGKECCFVEDPNQYVRDMQTDIKNGINDRFILFMLEPIAHGFHVAFPYGSWLQNQVQDAFWPDVRLMKQLGPWLDEGENGAQKHPIADTAVIYDLNSAWENMFREPGLGGTSTYNKIEKVSLDGVEELGRQASFAGDGEFTVHFELIQKLSDKNVMYNCIYESPDEPLTAERLAPYKRVIIPDAFLMDDATAAVLNTYRENGGEVIIIGRKAAALNADKCYAPEDNDVLVSDMLALDQAVRVMNDVPVGFSYNQGEGKKVLNLVNYNYNEETHRIDALDKVELQIADAFDEIKVSCFPENPALKVTKTESGICVENAGIYTVIELI